MRIGLLIYGSLDLLTGGFIYDRILVEHLRETGHEVEVFSLPWRRYAGQLAANINHSLVDQIEAAQLDLLLQDELCHPSLFLLNRRIKPAVNAPLVSIVHHLRISEQHPRLFRPLYRAVETRYLSTVDAWIYNSQTTRQSVEQVTGGDRPYVVAYPSGSRFEGFSVEQIEQRVKQDRPLQVVFVGSLIRRKGLHTLIEALAYLPDQAAELTIIGNAEADPIYTRAIRRQIGESGLAERVKLTGVLPADQLRDYLAGADVLAVPSQYEGFGIVYLEGMAFGLPAIASTGGAAHEIITPGQDGFLVPPGDSKALADCLQTLQSNPRQHLSMSLAARARFESHPTWVESAAQIEFFLRNCLNSQIVK